MGKTRDWEALQVGGDSQIQQKITTLSRAALPPPPPLFGILKKKNSLTCWSPWPAFIRAYGFPGLFFSFPEPFHFRVASTRVQSLNMYSRGRKIALWTLLASCGKIQRVPPELSLMGGKKPPNSAKADSHFAASSLALFRAYQPSETQISHIRKEGEKERGKKCFVGLQSRLETSNRF